MITDPDDTVIPLYGSKREDRKDWLVGLLVCVNQSNHQSMHALFFRKKFNLLFVMREHEHYRHVVSR